MQFIKQNLYKLFLLSYAFFTPAFVLYAECNPADGKICNPLGDTGPTSITVFIQTFLIEILKIGLPVVALAVIYCGFLFVVARGNEEKLTKAKDALLYTLIGAAILLGSLAIAHFISNTVDALK